MIETIRSVANEIKLSAYTAESADDKKMFAIWAGRLEQALSALSALPDVEKLKDETIKRMLVDHPSLSFQRKMIRSTIDHLAARGFLCGMPGWQSIETAPRDGTWIWAYYRSTDEQVMLRFIGTRWHDDYSRAYSEPDNWMTLPPAPITAAGGAKG